MRVVVGSVALKKYIPSWREPADYDVFVTHTVNSQSGEDCIVLPRKIIQLVRNVDGYAIPDSVYTIKLSHMQWDNNWDKHKADVLVLKEKYGCKLIFDLYYSLVEHWKKEYKDKPFLSLRQKKSKFFDDHVHYEVEHDKLHELLSFPDKPMYTHVLCDNEDVMVDRYKFLRLPFNYQVKLFREEIGVIAIERWILNKYNRGKYTIPQAWNLSLKKTITSLTKGWASMFILEHLEYFVKPDMGDFSHIVKTLKLEDETMTLSREDILEIAKEVATTYNETDPEYQISLEEEYELLEPILHGYPSVEGLEEIEQEGGGEGGAENCYTVFKWKGKVYKVFYNYYSHHGYDYEYMEGKEVKPVEKLVTVYE